MGEIVDVKNVQMQKRHCGIDLLRVIAILLICMSHANQTLRGMFTFPSFSANDLLTTGLAPLGTIGNILFIICSSYFLVDKSRSKLNKAINILFDSTLISITIMVGFLISKQPINADTIVRQIFPDLYRMNWFVPCYVIFYLIAPIVVMGLRHLTKEAHFAFLIGSLIIYGLLSVISLSPYGSELFHFFYILNIVAFIRWHKPHIYSHKKANFFFFLIGIVVCYLIYFSLYALSRQHDFFNRITIMSMLSPFLVLPLIALFNCFESMTFNNKFISYLSLCSLFVYVIHDNYLLREIARFNYYNWAVSTFGGEYMLLYMLLCGLFMFVVGFIAAVIYKETFGRITKYFADRITKLLIYLTNLLFRKLFSSKQ